MRPRPLVNKGRAPTHFIGLSPRRLEPSWMNIPSEVVIESPSTSVGCLASKCCDSCRIPPLWRREGCARANAHEGGFRRYRGAEGKCHFRADVPRKCGSGIHQSLWSETDRDRGDAGRSGPRAPFQPIGLRQAPAGRGFPGPRRPRRQRNRGSTGNALPSRTTNCSNF